MNRVDSVANTVAAGSADVGDGGRNVGLDDREEDVRGSRH